MARKKKPEEVFPDPPLKFFGGKSYFAETIHALAPPIESYKTRATPYGGALQEVWSWRYAGVSEVVNDLDLRLTNLWHCLKVPALFEKLQRELSLTPFGRPFFNAAAGNMRVWDKHEIAWAEKLDKEPSPFWAAMFFILVRQSYAGSQDSFAPLSKTRTRRGVNEQASAWWNCIDGLEEVHRRLSPVVVERLDALAFMTRYDGPQTFFYCDPPYLPETRTVKDGYRYEMTYQQHEEMLAHLLKLEGRVMLSGYPSELYDRVLVREAGWNCQTYNVTDNASQDKVKRRKEESLWMNYDPVSGQRIDPAPGPGS